MAHPRSDELLRLVDDEDVQAILEIVSMDEIAQAWCDFFAAEHHEIHTDEDSSTLLRPTQFWDRSVPARLRTGSTPVVTRSNGWKPRLRKAIDSAALSIPCASEGSAAGCGRESCACLSHPARRQRGDPATEHLARQRV